MYHIWSYLALADHIEIAFDTKTLRQSSYAIDYASGSNKEDTHRWARNLPAYLLSVVLELQAVLLPYRQYSETHDGNLIRCDRSWASILSLRRVMPARPLRVKRLRGLFRPICRGAFRAGLLRVRRIQGLPRKAKPALGLLRRVAAGVQFLNLLDDSVPYVAPYCLNQVTRPQARGRRLADIPARPR
jgi:hypothetical protein